jgi:glycosyltransferase involved in cell wall biosynthesis
LIWKHAIWVTWEDQRRNRELSRSLGVELHELREIDGIENRLVKYAVGIQRTFSLFRRRGARLVFCQNPSLVLTLFTILLKRIYGYRVVVDAHNAGLFPAQERWRLLAGVSRLVLRRADLTIVTNDRLKEHVERNGGKPFVLPDKIPDLPEKKGVKLRGAENLLFICSYADDEPYSVVFEAAKGLREDIVVYVTGNYKKRDLDPSAMPENVVLTGFLPEELYSQMLHSVDATIDLTTRENCLVCGAYESVAAGKPMVLSNTRALKEYFSMGAVYADHAVEDMRRAMREVLARKRELLAEVQQLKIVREREWLDRKSELERLIQRRM